MCVPGANVSLMCCSVRFSVGLFALATAACRPLPKFNCAVAFCVAGFEESWRVLFTLCAVGTEPFFFNFFEKRGGKGDAI